MTHTSQIARSQVRRSGCSFSDTFGNTCQRDRGIIIPAVLFASWADKGLALVVMGGLCRKKSGRVKTADRAGGGRNVDR